MKIKNLLIIGTLITAMFVACKTKETETPLPEVPPVSQHEQVARGKYLVTIAGCNDCHSPKIMTQHGPEPDPSRLLSGHIQDEALPKLDKDTGKDGWIRFNMSLTATAGPWGVSFAGNLTPHETGIGNWNFQQFKTAIQKGRYKGLEGGRMMLPPMPWQVYKNIKEDDLEAIFVYLKSLPPVNNLVPQPILNIQ